MKFPLLLGCAFLGASSAFGLQPENDALFVRVVDVGPGLCCVIKLPSGHNIVYDAGHWNGNGKAAATAIREFIPTNQPIELLILSHSDGDHLGATKFICDEYRVKRIVHSGVKRTTEVWKRANAAIKAEEQAGCKVTNLSETKLKPGTSFTFGGPLGSTKATLVCGFGLPPSDWDIKDEPEKMNAGSIILRLTYKARSILFCGDAVGRHSGSPANSCIASEKFMVDNKANVPIRADVIVAPHHGADNGSSEAFIKAVRPSFVIFSAGHQHEHPRKAAALRYLAAGVKKSHMFRTDRGDNEGPKEWEGKSTGIRTDPPEDDDVDILLRRTKEVVVDYAEH